MWALPLRVIVSLFYFKILVFALDTQNTETTEDLSINSTDRTETSTNRSEVHEKAPNVKRNVLNLAVPDFNEDKLNYKFLYRAWENLKKRHPYAHNSNHHRFHHREQRVDGSTKGQYRFELPTGKVQVVSYKQNEDEYLAKVNYLPEDESANPCLGLGDKCTGTDEDIEIENFDLDYDYVENEGRYGIPVHASELMNAGHTFSTLHKKGKSLSPIIHRTSFDKQDDSISTSSRKISKELPNPFSLYKAVHIDQGMMYGINHQVAVGPSYETGIQLFEQGTQDGSVVYEEADISSADRSKTKPYFEPLPKVVPLKPVILPVASQSNPEFFIPNIMNTKSYDKYSASNPAYYFHDDIPSYDTNIMVRPIDLQYKSNDFTPNLNHLSNQKEIKPVLKHSPQNTPHQFMVFNLNHENFHQPHVKHHKLTHFSKNLRNPSFINYRPHIQSFSPEIHNNNLKKLKFMNYMASATSPTTSKPFHHTNYEQGLRNSNDKVYHPSVTQSDFNNLKVIRNHRLKQIPSILSDQTSISSNNMMSRFKMNFPPIYRIQNPKFNSNFNSFMDMRSKAFPVVEDTLIPESILSLFASVPPPALNKNRGRSLNYLPTQKPLKFTTRDAFFKGAKREVNSDFKNSLSGFVPIVPENELTTSKKPIAHLESQSIKSADFVKRESHFPITLIGSDRFGFIDSGDKNINDILLSFYTGPQFAPVPFHGNTNIHSGKLSSSITSVSIPKKELLNPTDDNLPSASKLFLNSNGNQVLPLYPPLGDPNLRSSVIRFPNSDIVPISHKLSEASEDEKLKRHDKNIPIYIEPRKISEKRSNPRIKRFCPGCIKKAYTRQFILPHDHLRKSGAYIKLMGVRALHPGSVSPNY